MRIFKRRIEKPLGEKVREAMSVRDIHGNLPVMPMMEPDGTVTVLYGPVTMSIKSDSKVPEGYFDKQKEALCE